MLLMAATLEAVRRLGPLSTRCFAAVLAKRELQRICAQLAIKVSGSFVLYLHDDAEDLTKTSGVGGTAGFSAGNASHSPHDNDQTRYHEMVWLAAHCCSSLLPVLKDMFHMQGPRSPFVTFVSTVAVPLAQLAA